MSHSPEKMPRGSVYYDVRVHTVHDGKYVILYDGVDWSLAHRGPGFYHRLGTFPTAEEAEIAYKKHYAERLNEIISKLKEDINNVDDSE